MWYVSLAAQAQQNVLKRAEKMHSQVNILIGSICVAYFDRAIIIIIEPQSGRVFICAGSFCWLNANTMLRSAHGSFRYNFRFDLNLFWSARAELGGGEGEGVNPIYKRHLSLVVCTQRRQRERSARAINKCVRLAILRDVVVATQLLFHARV